MALEYHLGSFFHEGLKVVGIGHVQLAKRYLAISICILVLLGLLQHAEGAVSGEDAGGAVVCEPTSTETIAGSQLQCRAALFAEARAKETLERRFLKLFPIFIAVLANPRVPEFGVDFPCGESFFTEMGSRHC